MKPWGLSLLPPLCGFPHIWAHLVSNLISVAETLGPKQLGEVRVFSVYTSITEGQQGRTLRQEPGDGNRSREHREMLLTGLLPLAFSGYFYPTQYVLTSKAL